MKKGKSSNAENAYEQQAYKGIIGPGFPSTPEWKLDFVATAEGVYSFAENRYIYQYKDHLGNIRVSFAKNSAGVPEITDTNNYYPFGLNHISGQFRTANFGSYYSYKYNTKELQETGMFDYGWRQYMPDLGRWNGMDQLSETYASKSPFAYVANNPVSMRDPDGRWMDANGHIDTSGYANPFRDMAQSRMLMNEFLGRHSGEGGGGGYLAFGETQAYADLMTAFFNKGEGGASNKDGVLRWWTNYDDPDPNVKGVGALGFLKFIEDGLIGLTNSVDGFSRDLMRYQTTNFFKDAEKHLNGGIGVASAAISGQSKLPNGLKYLDKIKGLSKFSKVLGRAGAIGTALTVGVTFSEYYNDEWTAHTVINTALLAGTLAATVFGAPAVLTGIAIYGIADYTFGIGDKLDSEFGRGSIFWNTHIVN
ncbi:RHS repeat-associated core domain-containing protein [Chryseobacterium lactis]|uniref:RHS repeat-associated core domain-containing protein n=1 Tax=Chryseobacterium lactis TaxID=1241981 RepID=UPI0016271D60|nr:RHS repeat-associated core domain-containing protein [Chryseobacterium lactis]